MEQTKEYFVLTLPLKTQKWQEDRLNRRFEVNRQIYNALLGKALKRYRQMCQTRRYRELTGGLTEAEAPAERRALYQELDSLKAQYRLRKFDLTRDAAQYRLYFKENTDSPVAQNLAVHAYQALEGLMQGRAEQVYFKKEGELLSVSGKTNRTSIMFREGNLYWKKLVLPAVLKGNWYEQEALKAEVRYCRIKRRRVRGKWHYSAELVLRGRCPVKESWRVKRRGTVGLELGVHQVAAAGECRVGILPVPGTVRGREPGRRELLKAMERSRRHTNPENYRSDGRVRGNAGKWRESNHYKRLRLAYGEACRKQAVKRGEAHRELVRELLCYGDEFYVAERDYEKLKRRPRLEVWKGRGGARGMGSELNEAAPAGFLRLLERKLSQCGGRLHRIAVWAERGSFYEQVTGVEEGEPEGRNRQRIEEIQGKQSLYSAFVMRNTDEKTGRPDTEKCRREFPQFVRLCGEYEAHRELEKAG